MGGVHRSGGGRGRLTASGGRQRRGDHHRELRRGRGAGAVRRGPAAGLQRPQRTPRVRPASGSTATVVTVGLDLDEVLPYFDSCVRAAQLDNGVDVDNEEQGRWWPSAAARTWNGTRSGRTSSTTAEPLLPWFVPRCVPSGERLGRGDDRDEDDVLSGAMNERPSTGSWAACGTEPPLEAKATRHMTYGWGLGRSARPRPLVLVLSRASGSPAPHRGRRRRPRSPCPQWSQGIRRGRAPAPGCRR